MLEFNGWAIAGVAFFTDLILATASVYLMYWFYKTVLDETVISGADWAGINIEICQKELYPIIVSIWLILWACKSYLWGWELYKQVEYKGKDVRFAEEYSAASAGGGGMYSYWESPLCTVQ